VVLEAKKYRDYAQECVRLAGFAHTPEARKQLLNLARVWVDAAANEVRAAPVTDPDPLQTTAPPRRCDVRRKRIGVRDYHGWPWSKRLQAGLAQTLWVTLASFREFDNLLGDRVTGWVEDSVGALERHKGHLESNAHETSGLCIESVTVQVGPYRHSCASIQVKCE
jgi:hypothetical protein